MVLVEIFCKVSRMMHDDAFDFPDSQRSWILGKFLDCCALERKRKRRAWRALRLDMMRARMAAHWDMTGSCRDRLPKRRNGGDVSQWGLGLGNVVLSVLGEMAVLWTAKSKLDHLRLCTCPIAGLNTDREQLTP